MNYSGIYKIENTNTGCVYIGSAINLKARKRDHFLKLKKNKHYNKYLQNSFNKHGSISFKFIVIECVVDKSDLIEREQFWIDNYLSNKQKIYNICMHAGNTIGIRPSKKTREKLRNRMMGKKNHMYGKTHTKEARKKISEAQKNREYDDHFKNKMSLVTSGKNNGMYGKKHTDQAKKAISKKLQDRGGYIGSKNPNYGNKWSEEQKQNQSKKFKESGLFDGIKNPNYGNLKISKDKWQDIFIEYSLAKKGTKTAVAKTIAKRHGVSHATIFAIIANEKEKINKELVDIDKIEIVGGGVKVYGIAVKNDPSYCLSGGIVTKNSDLPDIDTDFEQRYRQRVVDHIYETYGNEYVCGISTDGIIKPKAAIRHIGRIMELPYEDYDPFSKAIYDGPQDGDPIDNAINKSRDAKSFAKKYPKYLAYIRRLIGRKQIGGRHAAGIIISGKNLTDGKRCTLIRRSGQIICNWSMKNVEYNGLLKLDVLGLATISVMKYCEQLIKEGHNKDFKLENISPDDHDQKIYDMINRGDTSGIFQISARPLTELCERMQLTNFNDMVAVIALVRPGPMDAGLTDKYIDRKHGQKYEGLHPIFDKITEKTYGVCVYQEQVSRVFIEIAGMSPGHADKLRKVITKKRDASEFEPYKIEFLEGCKKVGAFTQEQAKQFWTELLEFAKYCFNLSHSVAYSLISYRTAWLKANYPKEFYAATLTYASYNEKHYDESKHKQHVINEIESLGIQIMPPKSGISKATEWNIKNEKLYSPFSEIKGVGDTVSIKYAEWEPKPEPKRMGFLTSVTKKVIDESKSKIDIIMDDIEATSPDSIPDAALDLLPFTISKQVSAKKNINTNKQPVSRFRKQQTKSDDVKESIRRRIRNEKQTVDILNDKVKEHDKPENIVIYTDGSITKNPGGIGGIGIYMKYKNKEKRIGKSIGDGCTNNISEMTAIKVALQSVKAKNVPVRLFTDSMYCIGSLTMGWKTTSNIELVNDVKNEISRFSDIKLIHIRGHHGLSGNEEADKLAKGAIGVKYIPPNKKYTG